MAATPATTGHARRVSNATLEDAKIVCDNYFLGLAFTREALRAYSDASKLGFSLLRRGQAAERGAGAPNSASGAAGA